MVEVDGFVIIGANVEAQMRRVLAEQVLQQFSSNTLSLATRSNSNAHKVRAIWHLDVMLLLNSPLLLDILLARLLDEVGGIAYDRLSVLFARNDDSVDVRLPESFDNHA